MYQLKTCLDIKLGYLITLNIFYESSRYNVVKKYVEKEIIMVGHFSARVGSSGPEACHSFISFKFPRFFKAFLFLCRGSFRGS